MKKIMMFSVTLGGLFFFSGCAQPAPAKQTLTAQECETLQKKMIQTDTFIKEVSAMDAAHVDEALAAIPRTEITTSTNKPRVLKDANKRKAELQAAFANAGCKSDK